MWNKRKLPAVPEVAFGSAKPRGDLARLGYPALWEAGVLADPFARRLASPRVPGSFGIVILIEIPHSLRLTMRRSVLVPPGCAPPPAGGEEGGRGEAKFRLRLLLSAGEGERPPGSGAHVVRGGRRDAPFFEAPPNVSEGGGGGLIGPPGNTR